MSRRFSLTDSAGSDRVNNFPFDSVMNKGLTINSGQTHVQRYLDPLPERIEDGDIDSSFVVTHRGSLEEAPRLYETFNHKNDGCIKVILEPKAIPDSARQPSVRRSVGNRAVVANENVNPSSATPAA